MNYQDRHLVKSCCTKALPGCAESGPSATHSSIQKSSMEAAASLPTVFCCTAVSSCAARLSLRQPTRKSIVAGPSFQGCTLKQICSPDHVWTESRLQACQALVSQHSPAHPERMDAKTSRMTALKCVGYGQSSTCEAGAAPSSRGLTPAQPQTLQGQVPSCPQASEGPPRGQ